MTYQHALWTRVLSGICPNDKLILVTQSLSRLSNASCQQTAVFHTLSCTPALTHPLSAHSFCYQVSDATSYDQYEASYTLYQHTLLHTFFCTLHPTLHQVSDATSYDQYEAAVTTSTTTSASASSKRTYDQNHAAIINAVQKVTYLLLRPLLLFQPSLSIRTINPSCQHTCPQPLTNVSLRPLLCFPQVTYYFNLCRAVRSKDLPYACRTTTGYDGEGCKEDAMAYQYTILPKALYDDDHRHVMTRVGILITIYSCIFLFLLRPIIPM